MMSNSLPESSARAARRRSRNEWIVLGGAIAMAGLMGLYAVVAERQLVRSYEVERLQTQTKFVEENLRRQLAGLRHALIGVRHDWAANSKVMDADSLEKLRGVMVGVRAILVLDGAGNTIMSNDGMAGAQLNDRDYFRSLMGMKDLQTMYVSRPCESGPEASGIKVSLAMPANSRRVARVVTAVLNPEYFDGVMRSVLYSPDMKASIREQDGRPMVRVTPTAQTQCGKMPVRGASFWQHMAVDEPVFIQDRQDPDQTRLIIQRAIDQTDLTLDRPILISVSRNLAELDRPWEQLAVIYFGAWLAISACCSWALFASQRRRRTVEALGTRLDGELAQHTQRMELALSSANMGMWEQRLPGVQVSLDQRAAAILGYDSVGQLAKLRSWHDQVHEEDQERVSEALNAHIQGVTPALEVELRLAHRGGSWVWVQCRGKVVERDAAGAPVKLLGTWLDISQRKRHEQEVEQLAFYDGLTGLPNRRLLMDRLQRALARAKRTNQYGAVLFIDLDNFKTLNDTLGHDVGDKLLKQVAARLRESTRSTDTVARLGGDEFVVMLESLGTSSGESANQAEKLGLTIVAQLSAPYLLGGHDIHSSPSIGVALFGESCTGVDELLKHADLAMYDAKAAGRSTLRFFSPDMQASAAAGVELERDLRLALQRDELLLHYQPIFDARQKVVAVEALIRWQHPERGMVSPAGFIPLAEKTGLIIPLGEWVLNSACRLLRAWSTDEHLSRISISVNVSARQFRSHDFVGMVAQALHSSEADPHLLKLELTESMLLNDMDDVIAKMLALKALGVGFSLDDFGTGYSSLSYLKRLPLDQLKIDRSFVQEVMTNPSDAAIAKTIIELAHSLGLTVIAEGVETNEQHHFLLANACDGFQGFLFSPPCPIARMEQLLSAPAPANPLLPSNSFSVPA